MSDTFEIDADAPWAATTRVVPRDDAPAVVADLKAGDGGDLLMFGSATTWNPLLRLGLVDELIVLVGARLMGKGTPIYAGQPADLTLLGARVLPDSRLVELRYDASRP